MPLPLTCLDPDRLNTSSACSDRVRSSPRCAAASALYAAACSTRRSDTRAALTRAHSGESEPAWTVSFSSLRRREEQCADSSGERFSSS